jgi:integrase
MKRNIRDSTETRASNLPERIRVQIPAGSLLSVWVLAQEVLTKDSVSLERLAKLRASIGDLIRKYYHKKQLYLISPDYRIWQSVEELKRFLCACLNPKYRLMFSLLAWTGVRQHELLRVTREDFDFKKELLYIHVAKSSGEILPKPLPSKLCKELESYLEFFSFKTTTNNLRAYFKKVCKLLGYDKFYVKSLDGRPLYYFSVHSFRKWFATLVDSNGFGHFAIGDTRSVAEKHYIGKLERIRRIINELY